MMYNYLLTFHSWNRWLVVIFAVWAMYRNIQGLTSKRAFEATDRKVNAGFIGSLHLQALLGLILYFGLSPIVQMGLADMKGAMKNADLRFWTVEHITMMLLAVVIAQVGSIVSKKQATDTGKFRTAVIYFTIAILMIVVSIPWNTRPWIR